MPLLVGLMAAVFATSFVVPALGGPSIKKVFKVAKSARNTANDAKDAASQAQNTAIQAQNTANTANAAANAPDAIGATAFAQINAAGPSVGGRSTPGTTVTRPSTGRFCVSFPGVSAANKPAATSAHDNLSVASGAVAEVIIPSTCINTAHFEVLLKSENAGASGLMALSNNGYFSIVVP